MIFISSVGMEFGGVGFVQRAACLTGLDQHQLMRLKAQVIKRNGGIVVIHAVSRWNVCVFVCVYARAFVFLKVDQTRTL